MGGAKIAKLCNIPGALNMTTDRDKLTEQALALPADARLALADRLVGSLDPLTDDEDIRATWIAEAQRRRDQVLSGQVQTIPADKALARVRSRLKRED